MGVGKSDMRPEWAFYDSPKPRASLSERWVYRAASHPPSNLGDPVCLTPHLGPEGMGMPPCASLWTSGMWPFAPPNMQDQDADSLIISTSLPKACSQQEANAQ